MSYSGILNLIFSKREGEKKQNMCPIFLRKPASLECLVRLRIQVVSQ